MPSNLLREAGDDPRETHPNNAFDEQNFLLASRVHCSVLEATSAGAHYLGIGPVRTTPNKPDAGDAIGISGFSRVRGATTLPCVAIGGLSAADAAPLREAGAAGIAVIGAALDADDVAAAVRLLAQA